jgi:probable rRNA maturation factor
MLSVEMHRLRFSSRHLLSKREVHRVLQRLEETLARPLSGTLSVAFVGDKQIRSANRQYRGKDKTTDVLSFIYTTRPLHGEILISTNQAKRQARQQGVGLAQEVRRLFVHGLLHVLGFDHRKKIEARRMFALEEKVFYPGRL